MRLTHEYVGNDALVDMPGARQADGMNALQHAAPLLSRLFADAEVADAAALAPFRALSPAERTEMLRTLQTEHRAFYTKMANAYLPVSPELGRLLYVLARTKPARTIVEFGTSFGLSTIHLAAALRDGGGGRLITTEFEPSKVARARVNLVEATLADLVEFREGDALETLRRDVPKDVDLVLLDGAKSLYVPVLQLLEPSLAPGALIVADNVTQTPEFAAYVNDPKNGYVVVALPWDDGDCLLASHGA